MAYEEKQAAVKRPHTVIMEDRSRLSVTGVDEVGSFDENEIVVETNRGELVIRGEGLHIDKLSIDNGELKVTGSIGELSYEEPVPTGGFFSRLFR